MPNGASDDLFALLYDELHRLAEHHLRRDGASLTLGATTLLHEAYLNITERGVAFEDRSRFFAYASRAMRNVVVDYARRRRATKRGRSLEITLAGDAPPSAEALQTAADLEALSDALSELSAVAPELAELVDLHFFCGFTFAEIGTLRGTSERTEQRNWRKARALLHRTLIGDEPDAPA